MININRYIKSIHNPIFLKNISDLLNIRLNRTDGVYLDCTFGLGWHSREILYHLSSYGKLISLDLDPNVIAKNHLFDFRFNLFFENFSNFDKVLKKMNILKLDGIIIDLGISKDQMFDIKRGFSYKIFSPIDMRINYKSGLSAFEWLSNVDEKFLSYVIKTYGNEKYYLNIAKNIIFNRNLKPILSTKDLLNSISSSINKKKNVKFSASRVFQAIRIHINNELNELSNVLDKAFYYLNHLGRLVIISFHSLEDKIIKLFMKKKCKNYIIKSSYSDILLNHQCKSAKIRFLEKII